MVRCIFAWCGCEGNGIKIRKDILRGKKSAGLVRCESVRKGNFRGESERERERCALRQDSSDLDAGLVARDTHLRFSPQCPSYTVLIDRIRNAVETQRRRSCCDVANPAPVNFARKILQQTPVTMPPLLIASRVEFPGTWRALECRLFLPYPLFL